MRISLSQRRVLWAYGFLTVSLIFFITIRWYPTLLAINISFRDWNVLKGAGPWVGLENYRRLFADDPFPGHFAVVSDVVMNQPAACHQLRRALADVLEANAIGKDVVAHRRARLLRHEARIDRDADPVGDGVVQSPWHRGAPRLSSSAG